MRRGDFFASTVAPPAPVRASVILAIWLARILASLRKPGLPSDAAAAVVCLGTNDAAIVKKKMPGATPFVDRVKDFLSFLKCRRLLVVGPLGLRSPEGVKRAACAIERAVREMDASATATFHDVSSLPEICYQKRDRTLLTPDGQVELAMALAPKLRDLLRRKDEEPGRIHTIMEHIGQTSCESATREAHGAAFSLLV